MMKNLTKSYVALGGNIGDSVFLLEQALKEIAKIPKIADLKVSSFYDTSPVSDLPQNRYVNAVCSFFTTLQPLELLEKLQKIEKSLGKVAKPKNYPRLVDLDLLFFGTVNFKTDIGNPSSQVERAIICSNAFTRTYRRNFFF